MNNLLLIDVLFRYIEYLKLHKNKNNLWIDLYW